MYIAESFDDIYKTLVENELSYLEDIPDLHRNFLMKKLKVDDLSNWTIMDTIYNLVDNTYNYIDDIKSMYTDGIALEQRKLIAIKGDKSWLNRNIIYTINNKKVPLRLSPMKYDTAHERYAFWRIDPEYLREQGKTVLALDIPFIVLQQTYNDTLSLRYMGDYVRYDR